MSKGLHTLIKMHSEKIDTLRQQLNELEKKRDECSHALRRLQRLLIEEQEVAMNSTEASFTFEQYAKHNKSKQKELELLIVKLSATMQVVTDELTALFSEKKKYELVIEQHEAEEKKIAKAQENQSLDDIGIQQFIRNQDPTSDV